VLNSFEMRKHKVTKKSKKCHKVKHVSTKHSKNKIFKSKRSDAEQYLSSSSSIKNGDLKIKQRMSRFQEQLQSESKSSFKKQVKYSDAESKTKSSSSSSNKDATQITTKESTMKSTKPSLRDRLVSQLSASRFRFINEELYRTDSRNAAVLFNSDTSAYLDYHNGFQLQISKWPVNPVDKVIEYIQQRRDESLVVADFGCGDAKISRSVENVVHSFDLVALNDRVTVADMSHVPLEGESVDVAVFCLSLMGTNVSSFISEANRVLKSRGILIIAEVISRINSLDNFIKELKQFGFSLVEMDKKTSRMFVLLRLRKVRCYSVTDEESVISLSPCVCNKRSSSSSSF
jgi:ribosomal RNA-processing protein 8